MGNDRRWVLRKRYIELGKNLRAEWNIYIKFYTVFLTFSLAALAWVFSSDRRSPHVHMVAWTFLAQTLMTATASLLISLHSRQTLISQERIEKLLLDLEHTSLPPAPPQISIRMTAWAGGDASRCWGWRQFGSTSQ